MRRIVLFFALVAMTMPCMSQQLNYSVSSTYADEGKKVYLIDNLKGHAIDSMVIANGKFSFSGSAAAPAYKTDAIPDNILIDPQGKIIARALRGKTLHNHLQKIFEE